MAVTHLRIISSCFWVLNASYEFLKIALMSAEESELCVGLMFRDASACWRRHLRGVRRGVLPDRAYRWRGGRPANMTQVRRSAVCVLCRPAGRQGSRREATYWRAACQRPGKREKTGIPLQSREPRHEALELPSCLKATTEKSRDVWRVRVSHAITEF